MTDSIQPKEVIDEVVIEDLDNKNEVLTGYINKELERRNIPQESWKELQKEQMQEITNVAANNLEHDENDKREETLKAIKKEWKFDDCGSACTGEKDVNNKSSWKSIF